MNLIYICIFYQENYIELLKLLITSMSANANINKDTTEILLTTSPEFKPLIEKKLEGFDLTIHYYILDLHTIFEAACSRLEIFNYIDIHKYENILYLDTDILLNSDVNVLFNLDLASDKLYVLEEGTIGHEYWEGERFYDFTIHNKNTTAFTSGILLFKNSESIRSLFHSIKSHIIDDVYTKKNSIPLCLDQPFIVYNAITQNKYDNQILKKYVENNPSHVSVDKIVYHFPGCPGFYISKMSKMTEFWKKMTKEITKTVLDNKKYSWENSFITFLEDGEMNAFGKGVFIQEETYRFQANFGGRIHSLVFNSDYTEFISTRQDDGQIVKGVVVPMNKTIIQIGSHIGDTINDPIFNTVDNNTKLILVEPVPFLFKELQINYNKKFENNTIVFINKAVSDFIGEIEMTIPSEKNDFSKFPFWASQLSSVNNDHAVGHISNLLVEKINVQTTTINEIVKEYNIKHIDLLHTDTEGHDYTILMSYNFEIKPKQIIFEHKHMDGLFKTGIKYDKLSNKLLSLGYKKIQQTGEDTTFKLDM